MSSKMRHFAFCILVIHVQNVVFGRMESTIATVNTDGSLNGHLSHTLNLTFTAPTSNVVSLPITHRGSMEFTEISTPEFSRNDITLKSYNSVSLHHLAPISNAVPLPITQKSMEIINIATPQSVRNDIKLIPPMVYRLPLPVVKPETKNNLVVCYGVLGCFGKRDFYDLFKRPINYWPQSPEKINVWYLLYTSKNKYKPITLKYNLSKEDLLATDFDPKKPTKFIFHGFGSSFDTMQWMGDIKDIIFATTGDKYNVIGVDWSQGSQTVLYQQAVANTRVVGAATAHFIKKLVEYTELNLQSIHLIGHSLGAHISGYIGERFKYPQIGRITGLDPAGPDFYEDLAEARLDRTDATFVEAIHTDCGNAVLQGFGIWDTVGISDFYPNGGYRQPGCGITKGLFNVMLLGMNKGVLKTLTCNHQRAWILFIVDSDHNDERCQYVGYECESWTKFKTGQCGDCGPDQEKCGLFSFWGPDDPNYGNLYSQHMNHMRMIDTKNRRLYFKTSQHTPFCLHHYQIVIHIANDMPRTATGFIKLNLYGTRRKVHDFKLRKMMRSYKAGMKVTALGTWTKNLGEIHSVKLRWTFGGVQMLDPSKFLHYPDLHVKKIEVNYMSNFDPKIRKELSSVLCPELGPVIKSASRVVFKKCNITDSEEELETTTVASARYWIFG